MSENRRQKEVAEKEFRHIVRGLLRKTYGLVSDGPKFLRLFSASAPEGTRAYLRQDDPTDPYYTFLDVDWVHTYTVDCPHCDGNAVTNDGLQCDHCNYSGEQHRKVIYNLSCNLQSDSLEILDVDLGTIPDSLLDMEFDFS